MNADGSRLKAQAGSGGYRKWDSIRESSACVSRLKAGDEEQ